MNKALLVGINIYPDPDNELSGCINDINDMAKFLTKQRNFKSCDVRLLANDRANKKNIIERLNWLVTGAKKKDCLLFHYSGHGAQMATRARTGEPDKLDEVICPYDFNWTDETAIRDKEFHAIFKSIPSGVAFIWVSDSCHSADLSKGFKKPGNLHFRTMKPPADIAWRNLSALDLKLPVSKLSKTSSKLNLALISGCESAQESADAIFNDRPNGALTYYLLKTLNSTHGKTVKIKQLVVDINTQLDAAGYDQNPKVEGSVIIINKTFF